MTDRLIYTLLLIPGAIAGIVLAFIMTPLLWKLEGVLGIELAGHSGPAEWVLWSTVCCVWAVLCLLRYRRRKRSTPEDV